MRRLMLIVAAVLIAPVLAAAQNVAVPGKASTLSMLQTVIPRDPASAGMGAASSLEAGHSAYSAFSNPGIIPFSGEQMDFSFSWQRWQPKTPASSNNFSMGYAYNSGQKFGVALALSMDRIASYDVADGDGIIRGQYQPSNLAIAAGLSWRFIPELAISVTARYMYSNLYDDISFGAPAFDAALTFGKGMFKAAAGVRNLGKAVDGLYPLPSSAFAAVSAFRRFGKSAVEARLEAEDYFYGAFRFAAGASYSYGMLAARLGCNVGSKSPLGDFVSFGLGFAGYSVHVDAAYLCGNGPINGSLCIGIGFSF